MRQAFFRNLLFLVLINVLIKPLYIFGIDVSVQNRLGPSDYGLYFVLFNFTFLFQVVNDFGIQQFNNTHIARYPHLLGKYSSVILSLKCLLALLYLLLTLLLAAIQGLAGDHLGLLLLLAFNQVLVSLIGYLRSNISALGYYRMDSIASVLDRLLLIGFCALLLWGPWHDAFNVYSFAWSQALAYLITVLFSGGLVLRHIGRLRFSFQRSLLVSIFRQSTPYALMILLMAIYLKMDAVLLHELLPDGQLQAGYYAQGFRLYDAANMFAFLFATLLLPMFSRLLSDEGELKKLLDFSLAWMWVGSLAVSLCLIFCREPLLAFLYRDSAGAAPAFLWQMLGFPALALTHILGSLLLASGQVKKLNVLFAGIVLLYLVLNFILVPRLKAEGVSITMCILNYVLLAVQLILCIRRFRLSWPAGKVLRMLFFSLSSVLLACWLAGLAIPVYATCLLIALAVLLAGILLRVLPLRESAKYLRP